jgi:transposase InsO family protein
VGKTQSEVARRRADRAERERRRPQAQATRRAQRQYQFRVKVMRHYRRLRQQPGLTEQRAVALTVAKFQPRQAWHQRLSASTVRGWWRDLQAAHGDYAVLWPLSRRPKTGPPRLTAEQVEIIFTWRRVLGWGGHRIAAELKRRGLGHVSGQGVYRCLARLGLSVKTYALKGRSAGIAYRRYEKDRPNAQWHIDVKQTQLTTGQKAYLCIIVDDYSRYAVAARVGEHQTTTWVRQVLEEALRRAGRPNEVVSDNGREFVAVWEASLTEFGQALEQASIRHRLCAPFYPQGNGKAEAFIKILDREVLHGHTFETLAALQTAVDRFIVFYNNYRVHSALGWQAPVTRYAGCAPLRCQGLAAIPGLEPMAANPRWGQSVADAPLTISPRTALSARALTLVSNTVSKCL